MDTKQILADLKAERDRLDQAITALENLNDTDVAGSSNGGNRGTKRRTMSAAARRRISQAQKARWAKEKVGKKQEEKVPF